MTDDTIERRGAQVISSIGSIPQPISGIGMTGELFNFTDWDTGRLPDFPTVFSVGNVVTGKGNIVASRKHAERVTSDAIEAYLGLADDPEAARENAASQTSGDADASAKAVTEFLASEPPPSAAAYDATLALVAERQQAINYTGSFESWLKQVAPVPR
jgi:hypothetical protein